jgi:hypothetical protein
VFRVKRIDIVVALLVAILGPSFWMITTPSVPRAAFKRKFGTPPSRFVTLPGGARGHYRDAVPRNGRVLPLLHGSYASLFTWAQWTRRLAADFRMPGIEGDRVPLAFRLARVPLLNRVLLYVTPLSLVAEGSATPSPKNRSSPTT